MKPARMCIGITLIVLFFCPWGWAGRKFKPEPGEEVANDEWIVRFHPGANAGALLAAYVPGSKSRALGRHNAHWVKVPPGLQSAILDDLANRADVIYIEPNRLRHADLAVPNDPNYSRQWALSNLEATAAWSVLPGRYLTAASAGTSRVKIAVLDTGIDCTHPDFRNAGGTSADSILGGQINFSSSQALVATTIANAACSWQDDNGHGTHVAGIIAAATHNGLGVASLAYPAELLIYKVLDAKGYGDDATIAQAILAAADAGAKVISMSLGGEGYSQSLQDAVRYARGQGALVVASAGNAASSKLNFPAGANGAIGVAATDSANARATFSNYGPSVDLAAPGVNVYSTYPTYAASSTTLNYASLSGTSMAAPYVAALGGLLAAVNPGLSPDSLAQRLQQTAVSTAADGGWNTYLGYGIINARRAVTAVFRSASTGSIVGQVVGSDGLPLTGVVLSAGSVSVTTDASGLFRLSGLTPGSYSLNASWSGTPSAVPAMVIAGADTIMEIPWAAATGTLSGTVRSAGSALSGAVLDARADGALPFAAATDSEGRFRMAVPPGSYSFQGGAMSMAPTRMAGLSVSAGDNPSVDIVLSRLGTVRGVVQGEDGLPVAGASLSFVGAASAGAVADSAGSYQTLGLPAGTYTGTASATGFQVSAASSVTVANDADTLAAFTLKQVSVTVDPASVTLAGSQSRQFAATVLGATSSAVTWSRTPAIGTLSSTGLYTSPSSYTQGQTVTITATSVEHPNRSGSAVVTLKNVFNLSLSPSSTGGGSVTTANKITLDAAAPAGGAAITLLSSNPALAAVPATITIASGTTGTFPIATGAVTVSTPVIISASYGGVTKSATLTLLPIALSSLTLSPSSVAGGVATTSNRVALNGPAGPGGVTVAISVTVGPAVVPTSVSVAEGQIYSTYFTIQTTIVSEIKTVTVTASMGGVSRQAVLTVKPPALSSLTLSPSSVVCGLSTASNRVTLTGPAGPGGVFVPLSTSDATITLPAAAFVPENQTTSAYFTITTTYTTPTGIVAIGASYGGVSKTANLTVNPIAPSSVSLSPSSVVGGVVTTASRVTLNAPAAPGGTIVSLASSNSAVAAVPATITVTAGQTYALFTITTQYVPSATTATISAIIGSVTRQAVLTVNTVVLSSLTLSPTSVKGGLSTAYNRVTLNGPAPAGGAVVTLASSSPGAIPPASVTVAAGQTTSSYFTIATGAVTASSTAVITASYGGVSKSATLSITP